MENKKVVGLIFGGKSAEHDISIKSAEYIKNVLEVNNFQVILIGIDTNGHWRFVEDKDFSFIVNGDIKITNSKKIIPILQGNGECLVYDILEPNNMAKIKIDVAFPILHGPMGEDGTVQGVLKMMDIPFVGADVLGSAIGMNKIYMRKLLKGAGVLTANFLYFNKDEILNINYKNVVDNLKLPFFVKPANLGSSIGINKVDNKIDFKKAIDIAFKYDDKIIIEEYIDGREIECSVMGDETIIEASLPGEIILTNNKFYSYDIKYTCNNDVNFDIPAKLSLDVIEDIKDISIKVFKVLNCYGMARVDLFLTKDNKIFVNEINTIPGFTSISMYPKLWEISGVPSKNLIFNLVDLAIKRFKKEKHIKHSI